MTNNAHSSALVECHGGQVTVRFLGGSCLDVPRDVLARSILLRQALLENDGDEQGSVTVPEGILHSWLQWIRISAAPAIKNQPLESIPASQKVSTEDIIQYLQAAEFLDDKEAFHILCRQAAACLIPESQPTKHFSRAFPVSPHCVQILQELNTNLREHVLAASEDSCVELTAKLPPQLHAAAVQAKYPSVVAHRAIHVSRRDLWYFEQHWNTFWAAVITLPGLQSLSMIEMFRRCEQKYMPLQQLTTLTKLIMTGIDAKSLLSNFQGIFQGIDFVPVSNFLPALQHLELTSASLEDRHVPQLTTWLKRLTGLQHLSLRENEIDIEGAAVLAPCLAHLTNLQHLDLSDCEMTTQGVQHLLKYMGALTLLSFLDLSRNNMQHREHETLGCVLREMPNLRHLNVWDERKLVIIHQNRPLLPKLQGVTGLQHLELAIWHTYHTLDKRHRYVSDFLREMTQLTYLKLEHRGLSEEGVEVVVPALGCLSALQILDLRDCTLQCNSVKSLLSHIAPLTALRELDLASVGMCNAGFVALEQFLQGMSQPLLHLSVSMNDLGHKSQGIDVLLSGLASTTGLTSLELATNGLFWANSSHLAAALELLKCLQHLDLSNNELGDTAVTVLAPALGQLTALQELRLERNRISVGGIRALAPQLAKLSYLRILSIGCNSFCAESCGQLERHLSHLPALQQLDLRGCSFNMAHLHHFVQLLERNTTLEHLNLRHSEILGDLDIFFTRPRVSWRVIYDTDLVNPSEDEGAGLLWR